MSLGNSGFVGIQRFPQRSVNNGSPSAVLRNFIGGRRRKVESVLIDQERLDPLFLFYCGLRWQRESDNAAGWELVRGLRSWHREVRAIAAALLSKTQYARLLMRDLRSTKNGLHQIATQYTNQSESSEAGMLNTPYGLEISDNCVSCRIRKKGWFCALSSDVLQSFSSASHLSTYPSGAILFVEGQMPRGAFILCSGRVKLSTTSRDGKVLIVKIAQAGEVLGIKRRDFWDSLRSYSGNRYALPGKLR